MSQAASEKNYFDPKTLERIKRLDLRARLVVEGFITGQHRSPYNGFAIEFAGHREYAFGDDLKHIDWKVWSKTDRLYIKEYEEETNLKCTIILDCSTSMRYGEAEGWSKFDYGATAAASLAYMLQKQMDSVGLVTFSNKIEKNLKASSHPSHLKLMMHELQQTAPAEKTDISDVYLQLASQIKSRGLVVLISDLFMEPETLQETLRQFRLRHHEVIVLHVMHDHELDFPFEDMTLFRGLEMDAQLHAEPRALRQAYLDEVNEFMAKVKKICASNGVDHLTVNTSRPLDATLASYLTFRQKIKKNLLRK
jgi:uncharacterized protein (DUF58 family)